MDVDSAFLAHVVALVLVFVAGVVTGRVLRARRARATDDAHESLYATGVRPTLRALRGMREDDERAKREADGWRGDDSP